ncbi:GvpL/GvpF family gas vesicle protein [Neobacillus niacini]|uniref:GvpL/GvpF family gas vesicle protein n=1 Tax=Neobacillus niacini TaxID=86668 RepID=UPI001C8F01B2|nr:GvpL/GvpF family gas vesicle protein [Neobacillus niacini]MBY0147309.1 GvpL/GvpF family gas vesicle protein [Neobacillus niacini]
MARTAVENDFIYLYGVILKEELQKSEVPFIIGIDQKKTSIIPYKGLAAVITPVKPPEFFPAAYRPSIKRP